METIGYCSKFGHPFRLQVKPLTTVLAVSDVYIGFELILYIYRMYVCMYVCSVDIYRLVQIYFRIPLRAVKNVLDNYVLLTLGTVYLHRNQIQFKI